MISRWARNALRGQKDEEKPISSTKASLKIQELLLERLRVVYGLAQAIQYIHSKRLIHRDLKVANIGFDVHGVVKLFDFGLSRLLPTKETGQSSPPLDGQCENEGPATSSASVMTETFVMSRVGTKLYMAPEVRRKEPYGLPADVYSFGVVLWEILTLSTPCDVYQQEQCRRGHPSLKPGQKLNMDSKQCWLPICPCWPVGLNDLVTSCMSSHPDERPSMDDVLVVLSNHINELSNHVPQENVAIGKRPQSMSRVDLTRVDLLYLENVDGGNGSKNKSGTVSS
jgi:serine/threonine protein kinase